MNSKLIGLAVIALVVGAGVLGALVTDVATPAMEGSSASDSDSAGDAQRTPHENTVVVQETANGGSGGGGDGGAASSSGDADTTEQQPPFGFNIEKIEKCGRTCRDVTASLTNNQNAPTEDVVVRSVIFTGGDKIWEGQSNLGTIAPGESVTNTKRVKLGYTDAYKVKQNDGKIVIKTYVITEDATYVYKEARDVA